MGDELIQISIEVPRKLTEKQRQILREFAATEDAGGASQRKGFFGKLREKLTDGG